jgi:ubiquinone/menaquinone biosynthesis C-methylase UbiE
MTVSHMGQRPAYYDDQNLNYQEYWTGRTYEHRAEVMAIRRLLRGQRFEHAVDIGGGYGRISVVLSDYASRVTLVDSSQQQLDLAERFLSGHPLIARRRMDASDLQFEGCSADLVTMIRVLHHLPEPGRELRELHRILRPGGLALIEVANVAHALNRVRYLVRRKPIPLIPVDIRSESTRKLDGIPFVNHHPETLVGLLRETGLQLERMLSVSNLRHPVLKKSVPKPALLAVEHALQERFAQLYFGPSIFLLLRKAPADDPGGSAS